MIKVRTRFAPSPTGFLHIGSLRTALYAYLLAKHQGGDFILRIEDTDQKREVEGSKEALQTTLKKFGLIFDELYVQSERLKIYQDAALSLIADGKAFYCDCKPKNAKEEGFSNDLRDPCRDKELTKGAIKLLVPQNKMLTYYDFVHKKEISWNSDTVYDATLLKSDGFPTYHLAAMIDDIDMKISHVLRGHDWLPSTPIHLLVLEYLGAPKIEIGHLTDILSAETGKKLSKRRDSVFAEQFLEEGYLPEALLNFILLLGWAPKDNRELYTLPEMIENFEATGLQEANPKFLRDKLDWFNSQYIVKLSPDDLKNRISEFFGDKYDQNILEKVIPLINTRIKTFKEFESIAGFFFERIMPDPTLFNKDSINHLTVARKAIENLRDWNLEALNSSLMEVVNKNNFKTGDFFMDLRIAITGVKFTPPINDSIIILGKEETLYRLGDHIG